MIARVVLRVQDAAPGVEDLDRVDARLDLHQQVVGDLVGQLVQQARQQRRVGVEHRLEVPVVLGAAALDHVGRQRERRAGEADQGRAVAQLALDQAHGVGHVAGVLAGVDDAQGVHVGGRADGVVHPRAVVVEGEGRAHRLQRHQDVAEQDGRVEAEAPDRLQRDLAGQLRGLAQLDERDLLAHGAVLGQVAARLAHDPDRRALVRARPAGRPGRGLSAQCGHLVSGMGPPLRGGAAARATAARREEI